MVKREFAANPDIDVDAPRAKRHRETVAETPVTDEADLPEKDGSSERENDNDTNAAEAAPEMSPEEVLEEGLKVLQVLRDAVDREGRQISYDFLRLVSKRQFPDYYEIIKQPIALDDIKAQLESHAYPSLEALRQDLDTCFKNAKRYNQRESRIWKDAKHLQKLANKEIDKIVRRGDEDDEGSDKEGGKKKEKGTNIHRLMKNRLQKLLGKTDEAGRQLSPAFMDLPSKKKWAVYYKLISRPICIEDIFKRIKRKEYTTIQDFMSDVDLVFSNALQFNEEHSLIWEDALTLKTYFHQIMNDLPAKYNMNRADESSASPEVSHNRIKLKLPGHQSAAHANNTDTAQNGETSSVPMRIRVPGLGGSVAGTSGGGAINEDNKQAIAGSIKKAKTNSPAVPTASLPSSASIPHSTHPSTSPPNAVSAAALTSTPTLAMPTPKPARAAAIPSHMKSTPVGQTTLQQQQSTPYTPFHQYTTSTNPVSTQNYYSTSAAVTQTPARASATPAPSVPASATLTGRTDAPSPVPPPSTVGLHSARLESCSSGKQQSRRRLAVLDARAGVRNFALQIPLTESKFVVRAVKFTMRDGDGDAAEGSEAEEEVKVAPTPVKKRGRGRPRKVVPIDQEVQPPAAQVETSPTSPPKKEKEKEKQAWRLPVSSEVFVRLDGKEVTVSTKNIPATSTTPPVMVNGNGELPKRDDDDEKPAKPEDEWVIETSAGQHFLDIGRKGNTAFWRVYLCVS